MQVQACRKSYPSARPCRLPRTSRGGRERERRKKKASKKGKTSVVLPRRLSRSRRFFVQVVGLLPFQKRYPGTGITGAHSLVTGSSPFQDLSSLWTKEKPCQSRNIHFVRYSVRLPLLPVAAPAAT